MTLTTPYSATFVIGDGDTKTFSYLFEEVSESFISVMVYNTLTGLISEPTYTVDTDQKQIVFGDETPAPTTDEVVCIYRTTPNVQDVSFRTLQGYDAKSLENILSKIVAMIQEIKSNYFTTQVLQGDPWQLDLLTSADDGATVNIDYTAKKLVKGLYFRITSGNLQVSADGSTYITMPKSSDVAEFRQQQIELPDHTYQYKLQYRVGSTWYDAEANAQYTADAAYQLAETVQTGLSAHTNNLNNPHQTSLSNLTDVDISSLTAGQFVMFDGIKWKNVNSSVTASWGTILGDITDQTDLKNALDGKVNDTGDTMSGALDIIGSSNTNTNILNLGNGSTTTRYWHFQPSYSTQSMSLFCGSTETNGYRFVSTGFCPATNNARHLGASSLKWNTIYVTKINNGGNIGIPTGSGTMALLSDVEMAANSGTQLYTTGVWYAKMDEHSTVPSYAEVAGRNYADFSQTNEKGEPIIIIYEYADDKWNEVAVIDPPVEYNGYVTVTSKIWDIQEQTGQQGGKVLWSHINRTFTPYPLIVSFDNAALTGVSTCPTPDSDSPSNQIVNKDYVDNHIPQGLSTYHPTLFAHEWDDKIRNDVQWLRADTFSWQDGSVYEAAFNDLFNDIYISTSWRATGYANVYTASPTPEAGDTVYSDSACTTSVGTVTSYDSVNNQMEYNSVTWDYNSNSYVTPVSETVAGYSVDVYTGHSGKKIVSWQDESDVASIYTATGVAWYYIIDIPNKRFKLPRELPTTDKVKGNGMTLGLTNGTKNVGLATRSGQGDGNQHFPNGNAYGISVTATGPSDSDTYGAFGVTTDQDKSGIIVHRDNNNGKQYLYFYVGEFTQTAIENTAGITAETLNDKVDKGHQVIAFQAPTAGNNYTWYRKYADGWVEQGGNTTGNASVVLPVTMADLNYNLLITPIISGTNVSIHAVKSSTSEINIGASANVPQSWMVCGMAA